MAYSQTTASTLDDVMSQICAFAVANAGFTDEGVVNFSGANRYRISKGGIYWTFVRSYFDGLNHILCRMSYSISPTADPSSSNSQYEWTATSTWGFSGPFPNLYMFADSGCVFAVIEVTTGVFTHISIGNIEKLDTFVGGEFVAGNYMDRGYNTGTPSIWQYYHVDDSWNACPFTGGLSVKSTERSTYMRYIKPSGQANNHNDFAPFGREHNIANQAVGQSWNGWQQVLFDRTPNRATSRSILLPQNIFNYDYVLGNGLYHFSGFIPGMRIVSLELLDAGEIILNDWQVFPFCSKAGNKISYPVTYNYGFAFKRVA